MNVPSPTQSLQAPQSEDNQQVRLWVDFLLAFPGLHVCVVWYYKKPIKKFTFL